jgi:16S rRNA (guanine966-N2)-methyltransferase
MRIVGGKFAGWDLVSPNDARVRPTAEHVRDGIMRALGAELKDARLLDLFAGTGALGLEAISRGARSCDFVETRPSSLHALKANIVVVRAREHTRVFKRDALPFAAGLAPDAYDIAFVDPPYESRMLDRVIETWNTVGFSRILVAEHASTHPLPRAGKILRFDDTTVSVYRRN